LLKDGAVSKPFLTSHGYHIVKRLGKVPPAKKSDEKAMADLRDKVEQNERINTTKTALAAKILKDAGYQKQNFNEPELWIFSDSILNYRVSGRPVHLNGATALFKVGDKDLKVSDWISYAQTFRYKSDGSGLKPYPQLWDEFVQSSAIDYYQNHLEQYNVDFRQQINEFKDGNLFFEIMQREVWGPAQTDTDALMNYYEKNRGKYKWNPSADAVIFYASDLQTANQFLAQLKKSPSSWHSLVSSYNEKIASDSSRFELTQIPNRTKQALIAGVITTPVINKADNTASFAYILRNYNKIEPRSFADARGLVINDYQSELEKSWVEKLKNKYPVHIHDAVVNDLVKNKKF